MPSLSMYVQFLCANLYIIFIGPLWRMSEEVGSDRQKLCDCGGIQTLSSILDFCPLTNLNAGLQHLHTADEAAVR